MNKQKILLLLIILIGIFLRFYRLGDVPSSLNWDEVSWGYNAYSITQTGKDEHGASFPLSFQAFGDYKQPVYVYLAAVSVKLFDLNPFSVRLPSAVLGSATILFVYLLVAELFGKTCEEHLIQPVFVMDHPKETTPLCKPHRNNPELIERFEPYIGGKEIGNAYTELNDPDLQRHFFEEEVKSKAEGNNETHPLDEDFLTAMEYGMPPTGGLGLGVDRMIMIMTGTHSIRNIIAFPTLKSRKG